jgi:regulatory protein
LRITNISQAVKSPNRVNISVDGKYRFSLDVFQVGELGIKIGKEYSEEELVELETESQFGKLYARALEYTMLRPHSEREVKDYLWRKTRSTKYRSRTGEIKDRAGVSQEIADRVFVRLVEKGYLDDEKFTRWWVENRNQIKGVSKRKLQAELRAKGIENSVIESALETSGRSDEDELAKIIAKKRDRYETDQKLMAYLARQGFGYDDIKSALEKFDDTII